MSEPTRGNQPDRGGISRLISRFRLLLAVLLIWLIVRNLGGTRVILDSLSRLPVWAILVAATASTADRLLMTYKWLLLLRAHGAKIPLLKGTTIYCASMVWGMFLPATIGADFVRVISTKRHDLAGETVLASVVVERALGFMASLTLGLAGLVIVSAMAELPTELVPFWWICAGLFCIGFATVLISFTNQAYEIIDQRILRRFGESWLVTRLRKLHRSYYAYRAFPGQLITFFILSFVEQLVPVVAIWVIAVGIGVDLSPPYAVGVVALSFLIARIPITPGGIGIQEGVLVLLLRMKGIAAPDAMAIAVAARLIEIASWLPWWLAFVIPRGTLRRPADEGTS